MTREDKEAVMAFYVKLSERLSTAIAQAQDNVADRCMSVNVLMEFKKFLWEETKSYLDV